MIIHFAQVFRSKINSPSCVSLSFWEKEGENLLSGKLFRQQRIVVTLSFEKAMIYFVEDLGIEELASTSFGGEQ
jgi:hypothetical protein